VYNSNASESFLIKMLVDSNDDLLYPIAKRLTHFHMAGLSKIIFPLKVLHLWAISSKTVAKKLVPATYDNQIGEFVLTLLNSASRGGL